MSKRVELLSTGSYLCDSSGRLLDENKVVKWSQEENKRFENALALYDKDMPDRWVKVAAMIPGKTVGDVFNHYRELEDDISDIEAGLIPIPGYINNTFSVEWDDRQLSGDDYTSGGKRSFSARAFDQERNKGTPWTGEEHRQFLLGLKKYGKGDWRNISHYFVITRTPTQVASHAQKFFLRQLTGPKDKRRSSIHDITSVTSYDNKEPSTNKGTSQSSDQQIPEIQTALKPDLASIEYEHSSFVEPPCQMFSCGLKLQDQVSTKFKVEDLSINHEMQ